MTSSIVLGKREGSGAWKLVYIDDGILKPGFYFVNAGDPPTYSKASKDSVFRMLQKLVDNAAGQPEGKGARTS